jgi:G:T/U-mismatch repair DNA glycosylase
MLRKAIQAPPPRLSAQIFARGSVLKRRTAEEQARLADRRRHQAELKKKSEHLKALAAFALQNLGDHCPICAQTYDRGSTRARLEKLATTGLEDVVINSTSSTLNEMLSALSSKEKQVSDLELDLVGEELRDRESRSHKPKRCSRST